MEEEILGAKAQAVWMGSSQQRAPHTSQWSWGSPSRTLESWGVERPTVLVCLRLVRAFSAKIGKVLGKLR